VCLFLRCGRPTKVAATQRGHSSFYTAIVIIAFPELTLMKKRSAVALGRGGSTLLTIALVTGCLLMAVVVHTMF
jgi:hypothetical protein